MWWRGTNAQLHIFHASTSRNVYEQFDLCNTFSVVKMTSPAFGVGNAFYIISSGATKLEIGELKVISKIRKVIKFGTYRFNITGKILYFISLWCHFEITGRSSVIFLPVFLIKKRILSIHLWLQGGNSCVPPHKCAHLHLCIREKLCRSRMIRT